jgi:L-aspartate oxidase
VAAAGLLAAPGGGHQHAGHAEQVGGLPGLDARRREETRGCHWREDRPDRDDTAWRRHLVVRLGPDRALDVRPTDTQDFPPTDADAPREP